MRDPAAFRPPAAALSASRDPASAWPFRRLALLDDLAENRLIVAGNRVHVAPADRMVREIAGGFRSAGFSGAGGRAQTGWSGPVITAAAALRSCLPRTRRGGGASPTAEPEPLTRKTGTEAAERERRNSTATLKVRVWAS